MAAPVASIGAALADVVGAGRVSDAPPPVDGHRPRWSVAPRTIEEVSRIVALARDAGLAVLPRGSGSALGLGHPPRRGDVLLDLRGLDRVVEDRPEDLVVTVQAGVTAGALAGRLESRRQWLPVDPPGWSARTVGGLAATGASGPLRARYGTLRDLVLGARFVQADGVVTWGGARVVKSVTGYDVPKLLVGSLGTLGVLCELTLRLHPMPEVERTWIVGFTGAGVAGAFLDRVVDSTLQPNRVHVFDAAALRACELPVHPVAIVVAIGSAAPAVDEQGEALQAAARRDGGTVTAAPADVWARHDRALAGGPDDTVLHVASLPARLAETVSAVERGVAGLGPAARAIVAGCALLGTLRIVISGAEPGPLASLVETLRGLVVPLDGSVTVQAGPRALRETVDPWGPVDAGALALMSDIKQAFDPTGVLNPGRFVGGL